MNIAESGPSKIVRHLCADDDEVCVCVRDGGVLSQAKFKCVSSGESVGVQGKRARAAIRITLRRHASG